MRQFHHIGLPTDEPQAGEEYVAETKVWVTNPLTQRSAVEYLRFEADSPVSGPVRDQPHVAYRVDDLDAALAGATILLGPFNPRPKMRVVFIEQDGGVVELMEFADVSDTPWG